ncbi:hypothetical protein [Ereboglobus luteus]|uniref:Uncharacterized protein n=1 Tax=Ereboglobus luteus TaxID=1796921 RepID=A0A2U8E3W4_9BACT|nr:hypothetical protein [Ereboglobus luteus]AWI09455.1 hypothetical protein CKA38_09540 [Ereboglobus luteus]
MALCALLFGISTSTTLKGETASKSNTVLLEPETFRACGGWEVMDGQDGTTEIFIKATNTGGTALAGFGITTAGTYTIWANTRDYDTSPGSRRFKVLVDGQEPDIECGAHGVNGWRWERVKEIPLTSGTHTIEVKDTAQYLGRLEAVLVTSAGLDPNAVERASLNTYRQTPLQAARVPVQSPGLENPTVTEGAAGVAAELRTHDMALRFRKARTVDGQEFLLREIEFLTGNAATLSWRGNAEPIYLIRAAESTVRPGWAPRWKSAEFENWTFNGGTWTLPADTRNVFLAGDARAAYLPDSVAQVVDAKTIKILYKLRQGAVVTGFPDEITVTWQVPESGHAARMEVSMTTVQSGFYSLAFAATGAGGVSFDKVTAVQLPPLYQFKRLPDVPVMIMSSMAPHPMALVETSEISGMPALTHGVVADPDRLPSEWAERDNATHGFSLLGAELAAQPVVFSPVLGGHNSQKNNGDTLNAAWWVVTAPQPWFETMRDTDTGILRLRDYREPWNTSLTEQAINIIKLIKSGPQFRWYDNLKGPSNIESRSTATHSAPLMLVSAARLTRDDEFYKTRGLPTLEFMLSRSSAHFALSTDQTYVKRPEDIRLSFLRSSFYGTALWQGFDNLLGGLNPWLRDYMMNGTNVVTAGGQVPAWSEKLALHRSMPDIALLNTIKAEAKTWAATQFGNTTANQTPRDISYFYNVSFYPYWWDLLDLYELTGDAEILAYARQGASLTTAGQWVTPIVPADPAANLTLYAGGTLSVTRTIWWDGDERKRIGFPPNHPPGTPATFNIPEKNVPAWLPATTGLGLEQPSTYFTPNGLNNIQLAVWAANLMRLHSITGEDYWRTHARNAIIGRGASYPGYYLSLYSDLQYNPGYTENGPDITSLYWHHAPVHLAMLVDFLVTDADARTGGAIRFPYVKSQGYVWFSSRIYGGSPGRIFDDPACWLWLDNQKFNVNTPKVDHIAARSENRFHLVLMNQARDNTTARVFIDKAALGIALPASALLRDANGNTSTLAPDADGKFTVTLAQGGLVVLTFDAARETMAPDAPALSEKPIVASIDATWEDLHAFRIRSPHGADSLYVALSGIPDDGKMTLLFVDASGGTRAVATKDTAPSSSPPMTFPTAMLCASRFSLSKPEVLP